VKQALLIVDVQHGLFAKEPRPPEIDVVIRNINRMAQRARDAGDPVVFIQHEAPGTPLAYDAPAWQLDARLEVDPRDILIRKTTSAPYPSSDLQQQLRDREVSAVVVAGYATEFCIDSTVRWSASLGFPVTLVSNAHTTHDKAHLSAKQIIAHHNATLPAIQSLGAPIVAMPAEALWQS
jgi:nicotinamidase-related amidase